MKITVYEKNHDRGCPIKPIFAIDCVYWRYEPVNNSLQIIIGEKNREIGKVILHVDNIEFSIDESAENDK